MKLAVVIPVGPGHARYAVRAEDSVRVAWQNARGPFTSLHVEVVDDMRGALGRSAARNRGMDACVADWHFLLDADDEMMPRALPLVDLTMVATFGAVHLSTRKRARNIWPLTRDLLRENGAIGTLSMGCFVRGDLGLRFNEALDVGEDFDFYMRLPNFIKVEPPLVRIGYHAPSARGPRGVASHGVWLTVANKCIADYFAREQLSLTGE